MTLSTAQVVKGGKVWSKPQLIRTPTHVRIIFSSIASLGLTAAITGTILGLFWVPKMFSHKIVDTQTFLFTQPDFPYVLWLLILIPGGLGITIGGLIAGFPNLSRVMEAMFVIMIIPIILFLLPPLTAPVYEQNHAFTTWLSHDNGLKPLPSTNKTSLSDSPLTPTEVTNNKPIQMVNQKNQIVDVTFNVTPGKIQIKEITPANQPNLG